MIARKNLIALKKEFSRIKASGKVYDSLSFGLLINYGSSLAQVAFIVSKKIAKSSVVRHQVKRKLSDAVAPLLPRLPKNTELVFLAKQKAITSSPAELKIEIEEILKRAKLL